VDSYSSEEDQVKALKQWWERNATSILVGVGIALAVVFGTQWWQQRQQSLGDQAAHVYQQLLQSVEGAATDDVQRANARHLGGQLLEAGASSRFADNAHLLLARIAVESGDFAQAEEHLEAVMKRNPDTPQNALVARLYGLLGYAPDAHLGALARVRLARVQFAAGKLDEALATLGAAHDDDFLREREELRGDILYQRGDRDGALRAYRAAGSDPRASSLLLIKLHELERALAIPVAEKPHAAQETATQDAGVQP
jgi:predicted negative regulator of RcsB-dependent stress response